MASWKKSPKGMNLAQLKAYKKELEAGGHTGKEYGKVINLIKTFTPNEYSDEDMAGAYKSLSSGVIKAGGWTEEHSDDIYKYTGSRPTFTQDKNGNPLNKGKDLSSYLGGLQDTLYSNASNPEVRDSIVNQLDIDSEAPEPIDWSDMYDEMRGEYGVTELEGTLNTLTTQRDEEMAITEERTLDAEGKPVALGVISGRVGEIERQQTRRIDAINRQINTVTNQLNTAYNVIQTYMQFERMEYQDAVEQYNTDFSQALQMYNLIDSEMDEQVANARANLTLYSNAITSGNMSYGSLSPDQKLLINKMEIEAGLPVGYIAGLHMKPSDKLAGTSSDGSQALIVDKDGNFTLEDMPLFSPTAGIGTMSEGGGWEYTGTNDENLLGWSQTSETSDLSNAQVTKAKQKVISLGGTSADVKRVETDPTFALWVLAQ